MSTRKGNIIIHVKFGLFLCYAEYIGQRKILGGLLLLLPSIFNPENVDNMGEADHSTYTGEADHTPAEDVSRDILVELEQLLIHANIPVRGSNALQFSKFWY